MWFYAVVIWLVPSQHNTNVNSNHWNFRVFLTSRYLLSPCHTTYTICDCCIVHCSRTMLQGRLQLSRLRFLSQVLLSYSTRICCVYYWACVSCTLHFHLWIQSKGYLFRLNLHSRIWLSYANLLYWKAWITHAVCYIRRFQNLIAHFPKVLLRNFCPYTCMCFLHRGYSIKDYYMASICTQFSK